MARKASSKSTDSTAKLGFIRSEAKPQVVSEAKDNMVALPGQPFYSTQIQREGLSQLKIESQWPSRN